MEIFFGTILIFALTFLILSGLEKLIKIFKPRVSFFSDKEEEEQQQDYSRDYTTSEDYTSPNDYIYSQDIGDKPYPDGWRPQTPFEDWAYKNFD
jgi:hypothetical protein